MTRLVALLFVAMLAGLPVATAQQAREPNTRPRSTPRPAAEPEDSTGAISRLAVPPLRSIVFTEEREAAARAFVQKNRPEMSPVLDQLKLSKSTEYQQVICDLFRTSELFTAMRQEDAKRHELALKVWQVEARTQLLAAELVSDPTSEPLKSQLRSAVEELADLQIEQSAYEIKRLEAKVRRAEGQHKRLAGRRGEFVEERVRAILDAVGRVEANTKR